MIKSDKPISVIADFSGWGDGNIYYTTSPQDFYEVQDTVFSLRIYNEGGDTTETQEHYFNTDIEKDILAIIEEYSRYDLLGAISEISGIPTNDITTITINKKRLVVMSKRMEIVYDIKTQKTKKEKPKVSRLPNYQQRR